MRIGGGEYRGRILRAPHGEATRPTSGLVRETLFNILAPVLPEARFLDLYAGCGSVGLEALSRGASFAAFAEKDHAALGCLRGNIAMLQLDDRALVLPCPVERALNILERRAMSFAIVFLDPPFRDLRAYETVLERIAGGSLLAGEGLLVAQHDSRVTLPETVEPLACYRRRDMGDNTLSFYRRPS